MLENIHKKKQILNQILPNLEWESITTLLQGFTHFNQTLTCILTPLGTNKLISEKIQKTEKFTSLLLTNEFQAFSQEIETLSPSINSKSCISKIQKSMALTFEELNELAKTLEIFFRNIPLIRNNFDNDIVHTNFNLFKKGIEKSFLTSFRHFVTPNGNVQFEKHPLVGPLYIRKIQLENQIRNSLNKVLNSQYIQKKIQFNSFDIINDHYVIPIRSDSFNNSIGQVISRSDSGHTLFVEPQEISSLGYQRIQIVIEIQSLLSKIELDLSNTLTEFASDIYKIINFYYDCDDYIARSKFASKLNLTPPQLSEKKEIHLTNSFHPLIPEPVRNNIHVRENDLGLIISGPNTGGKTLTLKVLALTQIFLRHALFIPCEQSNIYLYEKIFYFGSDQQDLHSGLSSFSAEVENYIQLFEDLGESNLILIDEIFNSTSSEEASALAIAFFKKLHEISNVHLIVSSHHQTLKTILHQNEDFISAHVGFNSETNLPTYKLHYGSPGSSHALNIFNSMTSKHELFKNIYESSLTFLDNKVIHYEKLLQSISQKEHRLEKLLLENDQLNTQLKNQKKSMEGIIKLKIQDQVEKMQKQIKRIFSKAEAILSQTQKGEINKVRYLENKMSQVSKELTSLSPKDERATPLPSQENLYKPREILLGKKYFCLMLGKTVCVNKLDSRKGIAHISTGQISMKVSTQTLRIANSPQVKEQTGSIAHTFTKSKEVKVEYDCRGMRLDEFQSLIQELTCDLITDSVPFITIIHGHGTGVLKNWLREYIHKTKDLSVLPNKTGNDGETRIVSSYS